MILMPIDLLCYKNKFVVLSLACGSTGCGKLCVRNDSYWLEDARMWKGGEIRDGTMTDTHYVEKYTSGLIWRKVGKKRDFYSYEIASDHVTVIRDITEKLKTLIPNTKNVQ